MIQRIDAGPRMSEASIHHGVVYLAGQVPEDFVKPFTDKLQELALAGDLGAMKELFDRIEGKPQAAVELSGSSDEPLRIIHESK